MVKTSVARSGACSISGCGVIVRENPRHVGDAAERRRRPVAVDDGAAQRALVDPAATGRQREADSRHRMDRHQLVAQRHPAVLDRRVDADPLEAAEAEEVSHRLPHLHHREGRAGSGGDNLAEQRLGGLGPLDHQPHRGDRLAEIRRDVGVRSPGQAEPRRRAREPQRHGPAAAPRRHQNTCLTRNSSA
jgi:hypothetical protein